MRNTVSVPPEIDIFSKEQQFLHVLVAVADIRIKSIRVLNESVI